MRGSVFLKRSDEIRFEIRALEEQLRLKKAELTECTVHERKQDAKKFHRVPSVVRKNFRSYEELMSFINGEENCRGCLNYTYKKAKTPFERLCCLRSVGKKNAEETLKAIREGTA